MYGETEGCEKLCGFDCTHFAALARLLREAMHCGEKLNRTAFLKATPHNCVFALQRIFSANSAV